MRASGARVGHPREGRVGRVGFQPPTFLLTDGSRSHALIIFSEKNT